MSFRFSGNTVTKNQPKVFTRELFNKIMRNINLMTYSDGEVSKSNTVEVIGHYKTNFDENDYKSIKKALDAMAMSNRNSTSGFVYPSDIERLLEVYVIDDITQFSFELNEETYEDLVQIISIFDADGSRFEMRIWTDLLEYESYKKASEAGVIDSELYKIINKFSILERKANTWKEIRQNG